MIAGGVSLIDSSPVPLIRHSDDTTIQILRKKILNCHEYIDNRVRADRVRTPGCFRIKFAPHACEDLLDLTGQLIIIELAPGPEQVNIFFTVCNFHNDIQFFVARVNDTIAQVFIDNTFGTKLNFV